MEKQAAEAQSHSTELGSKSKKKKNKNRSSSRKSESADATKKEDNIPKSLKDPVLEDLNSGNPTREDNQEGASSDIKKKDSFETSKDAGERIGMEIQDKLEEVAESKSQKKRRRRKANKLAASATWAELEGENCNEANAPDIDTYFSASQAEAIEEGIRKAIVQFHQSDVVSQSLYVTVASMEKYEIKNMLSLKVDISKSQPGAPLEVSCCQQRLGRNPEGLAEGDDKNHIENMPSAAPLEDLLRHTKGQEAEPLPDGSLEVGRRVPSHPGGKPVQGEKESPAVETSCQDHLTDHVKPAKSCEEDLSSLEKLPRTTSEEIEAAGHATTKIGPALDQSEKKINVENFLAGATIDGETLSHRSTTDGESFVEKPNKSEKNVSFKLEAESPKAPAKTEQLIEGKTKAQLKAERKAAFEAQRKDLVKDKGEGEAKSKSELRAERRAKQEAQREAKVMEGAAKQNKPAAPQQQPSNKPAAPQQQPPNKPAEPAKPEVQATEAPPAVKPSESAVSKTNRAQSPVPAIQQKYRLPPFLSLYGHYPRHEDCLKFVARYGEEQNYKIPDYILRLGLDLAKRKVRGTMASLALTLYSLKQAILDYETPPGEQLSRDLEAQIKFYSDYLNSCWPQSLPAAALVREIRQKINSIPPSMSDQEAKDSVVEDIDKCLTQDVDMATDVLVRLMTTYIQHASTVVTYSASSLVRRALIEAHHKGLQFNVVIVDSAPLYEGFDMLEELVSEGVKCTYMDECINSQLRLHQGHGLIGASCYLASDGSLVTNAGTAQMTLALRNAQITIQACVQNSKLLPETAYTAQPGFNVINDSAELKKDLSTLPNPPQQSNCLGFHYDTLSSKMYDFAITEKSAQLMRNSVTFYPEHLEPEPGAKFSS